MLKNLLIFCSLSILTMGSALAFSDVDAGNENLDAINYLSENGIVNGYADGSYQPERLINRAEFVKILIETKLGFNPQTSAAACFDDVQASDWFSSYVCYAKLNNLVSGYGDNTFGPANEINLAEAATIVSNVLGVDPVEVEEGSQWFRPFVNALADNKYIPRSFSYAGQPVSRGQMAELIWRVKENVQSREFIAASELRDRNCKALEEYIPASVDMERVRQTWLDWYNAERALYGLEPYRLNGQLNRTAVIWSEEAERRGYIDHKRAGQTAYYDYNIITNWFKNLGLTFKNVNRITYTESINWGIFRCDQEDCTDEMIESIRTGFDFFMSEKGMSYRPHYNAIVNAHFREIGLGIALNEATGKYYLTSHFGTEITSDPEPICD